MEGKNIPSQSNDLTINEAIVNEVENNCIEEPSNKDNNDIKPAKRKLDRKIIIIGSAIFSILLAFWCIREYTRNQVANNEYRKGIKILISEESIGGFTETEKYFKNYKVDYAYSKHMGSVNLLLSLIDQYNRKKSELDKSIQVQGYMDSAGNAVTTLDHYIRCY